MNLVFNKIRIPKSFELGGRDNQIVLQNNVSNIKRPKDSIEEAFKTMEY